MCLFALSLSYINVDIGSGKIKLCFDNPHGHQLVQLFLNSPHTHECDGWKEIQAKLGKYMILFNRKGLQGF